MFDFSTLEGSTFVRQIEYRDEIGSTNSLALSLAQRRDVQTPLLVLAKRQTGGRGRGANRWWSSEGALTCSLLLDGPAHGLPVSSWPRASLMTGLAVCLALRERLPQADVRVKWPNDVYLESRKVAGILIETTVARTEAMVIGLGVNVNNSLTTAPAEVRRSAVAMCDVAGDPCDLTGLLASLLQHLESEFAAVSTGRDALSERWSEYCLLSGHRVQVSSPAGDVEGLCRGIDEQGALLLETDRRLVRCLAGSVSWQPHRGD